MGREAERAFVLTTLLSAQKIADLFGHDIRTVHRWEKTTVPRPAMLWVARMASECSRGKSTTIRHLEKLRELAESAPKTVDVDAA